MRAFFAGVMVLVAATAFVVGCGPDYPPPDRPDYPIGPCPAPRPDGCDCPGPCPCPVPCPCPCKDGKCRPKTAGEIAELFEEKIPPGGVRHCPRPWGVCRRCHTPG